MRLSENDREVLACAFFQADAPVSKIAEECELAQHVVRRSLENLLTSGYITRRMYLNHFRLGYLDFRFIFSVTADHGESAQRIIDQLRCAPEVYWMGTLGPTVQYECGVVTRSPSDLQNFFDRVLRQTGPVRLHKELLVMLSHTWFVPKFLSPKRRVHRSLSCSACDTPVTIDEVDHRILSHVTRSACSSLAQVARDLGLSPSTIAYRFERLKESGVILADGYRIAASHKVGMVPFRLRITLTRPLVECRSRIQAFCDESVGVYYLSELQGRFDVSLGCRVMHPRDIPSVAEALRRYLGDMVGQIDSVTEDQNIKHATYAFSQAGSSVAPELGLSTEIQ